tara:strand:+ start:38 stop:184 length:147 start_codon:yes stop_codon:yes gene_type:complete
MGSYISKDDLDEMEINLNGDSLKFILRKFINFILILFILKIFKNYLRE